MESILHRRRDRGPGLGSPPERGVRPPWLKVRLPSGANYHDLKRLVRENGLHTVCESASCPNIGECWERRSLTFMILGQVCTRSCGFCDVANGRPAVLDRDEPARVARAVARLGLRYIVITSVNRDELPDGGAAVWAETIRRVRVAAPEAEVEALVPDFCGDEAALRTVIDAGPHVLAHNLETVPRLYRRVRPQAVYERSLDVIQAIGRAGIISKTGIMAGLGEEPAEVSAVLRDAAGAGARIVTIGQYLRPSPAHLPVARFVHPDEFRAWKLEGEALGVGHVESGPLVRSSYHADGVREQLGS
jgi:lipoic acid synthetase